ncbi:diguanylate cyclase [Domibacillus sp. 8LH]|uniref:sensor domain-containing diguanylate cyclase n=1 Tax=Domibacillus sp. 8LH TaxID=3073900 RepID=UPI00317FE4BF
MGPKWTKIKLYKGRLLAALFLAGNVWFAFAYPQGFAQKGFGASELIILFIYIGVIWGAGALYDRQQKQKDILQHNHDRFRLIFEKSGVGIALMEPGGKIVFVNPKMTEMFGYKKEAFLNMTFRDFSHPKDVLPNNDLLDKLVSGEIEYYQLEKRYICEDGRTIWGKVTSSLMVEEDEQETLIIGVVVDITERKMMERKLKEANESLEKMSHTDSLTGLLNRRGIEKRLETEWENARKNGHFISFMIIDIDYFKHYNDHYGHLKGDSCLIKVGGVIQKTMEQSGACISRYGGEEFLIALLGCSPEEALLRAEALCQSIEEERIEHKNSPAAPWVTVSIGAAGLIPGASHSFTALFKQADQALYRAKQNGRNRVHTQLSSSNEAKLLRRHP